MAGPLRLARESPIRRKLELKQRIMSLYDFLSPDAVLPALRAANKKQAIQEIAARAATLTGLRERDVFDALLQRERLGSTGIGNGIAIPHGKLPQLGRLFGLFARMEKPIAFEAVDGEPVDLIFLLLAPEDAGADHLKALSRAARVLRDPSTIAQLRATHDVAALHALLTRMPTPHAA